MASKPYPDMRRGTWLMKWKPDPDGPWVKVTLGKDARLKGARPPRTPTDAIARRAAEFADLEFRARHGVPGGVRRRRTLAEYADEYKGTYPVGHDDTTVPEMSRHIDRFVQMCDRLGVLHVGDVTGTTCLQYLKLRRRDVSPNTLKKERGFISGLFGRAEQDGLIDANPWRGVRVGKKGEKIGPEKQPRFWDAESVARIVAACRLEWHRDIVVVMADTGIRVSATLAMEWRWVDLEARTIDVPGLHNKGGHPYRIFVRDAAMAVLRRRRAGASDGSRYVFEGRPGEPYGYDGTKKFFLRAVARAGVPRGTPHDLRHTFGRRLHMEGVPQSVIQRMLGHASSAATAIYTDVGEDDAVAFMRGLSTPPGHRSAGDPGTGPRPASPPS